MMRTRIILFALLLTGGSLTARAQTSKYDVNGDGAVNAADVLALVNCIMNPEGYGSDTGDGRSFDWASILSPSARTQS